MCGHSSDDNPPFLLVIDIGHSFELYADFSRLGKVFTAFPDARSHRFPLDDRKNPRMTSSWSAAAARRRRRRAERRPPRSP
jgi:hypothetical protein